MRKLLLALLIVTSLCGVSNAITRTAAAGGGNWSSAATWTPASVPTATMEVVFAATSGSVTVDGATATCFDINFRNFTKTFTCNTGETLTIASSFELGSGMLLQGTGNITMSASALTKIITSAGIAIPQQVTFTGVTGQTFTLYDDFTFNNTLRFITAQTTLNKNTIYLNAGLYWNATTSVNATNGFNFQFTGTGTCGASSVSTAINAPFTVNTAGTFYWGTYFNMSGNSFTWTSGTMNNAANGRFGVTGATFSLNAYGITMPWIALTANTALTLLSSLDCVGLQSQSSDQILGNYPIHMGWLEKTSSGANRLLTLKFGQTYEVDSYIQVVGSYQSLNAPPTVLYQCGIKTESSGSVAHIKYNGTADNIRLYKAELTDLNCSLSAVPLYNWLGTVTRCTNLSAVTDADIGGGGGGSAVNVFGIM